MSELEAELILRRWFENKMLWFEEEGPHGWVVLHQAMSVLGKDEVDRINAEVKKLLED
jgi:hypothetical protein